MLEHIKVLIFKEGHRFVARASGLLISEVGSTEKEALTNLKKAIAALHSDYGLKKYPENRLDGEAAIKKVTIAVEMKKK